VNGKASARTRLLAIAPDPARHYDQAGGVLADSRLLFQGALDSEYEVRIVDSLMRAYPRPGLLERMSAALRRIAWTIGVLLTWRPRTVVALCSEGTSYYEKSFLLGLAKLTGARTFLCPRSGFQEGWLNESRLARTWVRWSARWIDGFIVQSRFWFDLHARHGVPEQRMHVWFNVLETSRWAALAAERQPAVGRPFRFLFLGWAVREKGLAELVEATARLAVRGGPPFEVIVAGDGAHGRELQKLRVRNEAALPPELVLLGWVIGSERENALRRADALVLPTWVEGFPNVVLEAMACALPVIATPVGAIPEVVHDPETGIMVPVGSAERLAEAMDRMRRDPETAFRMGQRGLAVVRERFDAALGLARFRDLIRRNGPQ
jgi:glycosyltransferase involved in cell wall biosynthesis